MVKTCSRTRLVMSVLLSVGFCAAAVGKTIYVDDDATGANNGTSWTDAYTFLQEALADANSAEKPVEIRVAQGTYRPDEGFVAIPEFDWRTTTFQLINGVTLRGGYVGLGDADPNARDTAAHETILSGDLNGDDNEVADLRDFLLEPMRIENSFHVVTGSWTDNTAILDGFVISGGNALDNGAGMLNESATPIVSNCTFAANVARNGRGGGMSNEMSSPALIKCAFRSNLAAFGGGIAYRGAGSPTIINCTVSDNLAMRTGGGISCHSLDSPVIKKCVISGNTSMSYGGGIYCIWSGAIITDCTISENWSWSYGGGIFCEHTPPTIGRCLITGNWAYFGGGGIDCLVSSPIITKCTITENTSISYHGGGMFSSRSSPIVSNCIISENSAYYDGGGIHCHGADPEGGTVQIRNCTIAVNSASRNGGAISSETRARVTVENCILWGNSVSQLKGDAVVSYSNVQGGWQGEGNIDADPLFADARHWVHVNGPKIVVEPNDPNAVWVDDDYHLKSEAGRWDAASQSWIVDDVTSPCIDAGDPNTPIGDELAPNGGVINMGAYGGTSEASMSHVEQIVYIQWLGHSIVKIWTEDYVVYVDPERVPQSLHDADLVCVTHTHGDHYSPSDIAKVSNAQTQFIGPPDVVQRYGSGQTIAPEQTIQLDGVSVTGVRAYNTNKPNHPKSNNWVGYVVEIASKRIYIAGDTDLIDEMKTLADIDVAFLPAGGTYTMNAVEAAEATQYIKPGLAIPYHWGQNVGTLSDAQRFVDLAKSAAQVMTVNETISSDNWPEYSPLVAHWKLDETEGAVAHDSAGDNDGTAYGTPVWRSTDGKVNGALELVKIPTIYVDSLNND